MSDRKRPPALTDAKGMGGVVAMDGFDYQLWDGIARVPHWLASPAFEELIFEGLEDLEARFFAPHAAPTYRVLERYQAKSGDLSPTDVKTVLLSFQRFDSQFPCVARVQTLVTPRLPPRLAWLSRDPSRVRRARPFYAPFGDVSAASDARLHGDLAEEYGADLGSFVASSVEIHERVLPDRASAQATFSLALHSAFPTIEVSGRRVEAAFEALSVLASRSIGRPISREDLRRAIEGGLGEALPLPTVFPLILRVDRLELDDSALQIDAVDFSGSAGPFPETAIWNERLVQPLDQTAHWLRGRGVTRVKVLGSYRLSTAVAVGRSLRSAVGFELEIPTRSGVWSTDDHATSAEAPPWVITSPTALTDGTLAVAIGVLRNPGPDLADTAGVNGKAVLIAHLPIPIESGRAAQASVALLKQAVDTAVSRLKPSSIELYLACPAALAVALGHRWNAMPPTQLHEFIASASRYVRTASI